MCEDDLLGGVRADLAAVVDMPLELLLQLVHLGEKKCGYQLH